MRKVFLFSFGLMSLVAFTTFTSQPTQALSGRCMWSDFELGCDPSYADGHCAVPDGCTDVVVVE
ncbi:hypothetical protein ACFOUP_11585 [Belliella kenyensis]|uniref:Secreted protein n=1 Tax=Belliella kenyensis TaxID=1472724 RepID=A0ABV8ELZ6_9BACT|nr:hypothetical protein [Belliella kenyensis]MCH7400604.1 hypothetical protein [Belliella kenyensis]MDN3602109.1 hypothetical protein [Belliella kenyensis]